MSSRQLVVLGTASQAPTRYRAHNSYALRWDDQLILFDPGEGTQRQCTLAGIAIARATAVCITHFHGDHCLGLPGVIQRRALDNRSTDPSRPGSRSTDPSRPGSRSTDPSRQGLPPLPVFFPRDGQQYFDRMRRISIFHDVSGVEARPIGTTGPVETLGQLRLSAVALDHRVTTYGYRLDEPDGRRMDRDLLARYGISGPDIGRLQRAGWIDTDGGRVDLDDVSTPRRGQSMAFVMDTALCEAAVDLARGVDLLVCESTFLHSEVELARRYCHLTARQAAELASEAGARRLVLTHFSARYPDNEAFAVEASRHHPDVVVAEDLLTIDVPTRQ